MSDKEFELILGILFLILSIILFVIEIKDWKKLNKKDFIRKSFKVNILTSSYAFFIGGLIGISRYFFDN